MTGVPGPEVGEEVEFATKPELARRTLERLLTQHGPGGVAVVYRR